MGGGGEIEESCFLCVTGRKKAEGGKGWSHKLSCIRGRERTESGFILCPVNHDG